MSARPIPPLVSPENGRDPYPLYQLLREHSPVHWDAATSSWYISRYADVAELLLDARLGAHDYPDVIHTLPEQDRAVIAPVEDHLARWPVFSDRPSQALLRRRLQSVLTRSAVQPLEPEIRAAVRRHVQEGLAGPADLLDDFARPAARWTVSRLLGVHAEQEGRQLEAWSDLLIEYLRHAGLDAEVARVALPAVTGLTSFVRDELLPRATTPMAVQLARATEDPRIEPADVVAMVAQLVTGGIEPTATATCTAALGMSVQSSRTAGEGGVPTDDAAVVEAALRAEPPFQFAPREAKASFDYKGHQIIKGQRVVLLLASAGREDMAEAGTTGCPVTGAGGAGHRPRPHLAFGRGRHYCLGAPLARMHLQAAVAELRAAGVPERLDRTAVVRDEVFGLAAYRSVPLRA
ncbi:cytochrome P450 [Streptomyces sp. cg36]|uniref:cytochrome P450 n=1 Tax=Streptomyces sp. cg36 TaxID=3238798 RepID=UPI0034E2441D